MQVHTTQQPLYILYNHVTHYDQCSVNHMTIHIHVAVRIHTEDALGTKGQTVNLVHTYLRKGILSAHA